MGASCGALHAIDPGLRPMEPLVGQALAFGIGLELGFHWVELGFGPVCQRSALVVRRTSIAVGGNAIST